MNELGRRIRELRRSKGLTQVEVAESADLSQSYLSRIEQGQLVNPTSDSVARLADALGVPVALLYIPAGAEALVLRAELQMAVEHALRSGGDPRPAVDDFIARLGPQIDDAGALERWGQRLIESYTALGQLGGHERQLGGEVTVTGEYTEGCLQPAGNATALTTGTLEALRLGAKGLLPGAHKGDYALLARTQSVRYGDLVLVEHAGKTLLRRIFLAGEGEIDLVNPDGVSGPHRLRRDEVRVLGRITGLFFRAPALESRPV